MRVRPSHKTARWVMAAALGSILLVTACAGMDPGPARKEINRAQTFVQRAQSVDALAYAPSDLRSAEEKLAQAGEALRNGSYTRALRLAEQAGVDARMAEAQAQSARLRENIDELQHRNGELQRKVERTQSTSARKMQ